MPWEDSEKLSSQELGPWGREIEQGSQLGRVTRHPNWEEGCGGGEGRACVGDRSFKMYEYY